MLMIKLFLVLYLKIEEHNIANYRFVKVGTVLFNFNDEYTSEAPQIVL